MYTTAVQFDWAWLIDPANPSVQVVAGVGTYSGQFTPFNLSEQMEGEVRAYAAGRFRGVTGPAVARTASVPLGVCTDTQVRQLRAWKGTVLLLRDGTGQRQFGMYLSLSESWLTGITDPPLADVTLAWQETTYLEAV